MALRFECWIHFIFCLVLFMGCTNGARNVVKHDQTDQRAYVTAYGNDGKDTNDHPYTTGYTKETKNSYVTAYGNSKDTDEQPYITGYNGYTQGTKQTSYVTSYGDNGKEKNEQLYITGYNGYTQGTKQSSYATSYGKTGKEKNEQPYMTGYIRNPKETKQLSYVTAYGGDRKEADDEQPYITGYIGYTQGTKQNSYGDGKETNERPSQDARSKCKTHSHAHSLPENGEDHHKHMGHGNHHHMHMHMQPSVDKDHSEAFKVGFFTPDDLSAGKTMPLYFPIEDYTRFLPKEVAESIPFSTFQLPNLLQLFSIPQGSPEAKGVKRTLQDCELRPIEGEIKLCATSLESMVEFTRSIIGSGVNLNLLSTTHPTLPASLTQNYTVLEAPKRVLAPKMVFCHPMPYPYAVFFCHFFGTETKVLRVALGGESGDKVEAVAICHMDTSDWDPNHGLFRLLGVKPGPSSPVCHFLPANHLVWAPSPTTAAQ